MSIEAQITLRREDFPALGRERIRLLEEVARAGSIAGGARAAGLTYKAAWDALDAMSRVIAQPLISTRAGGKDRGGAVLTEAGRRLIAVFHRLEAEMARIARDVAGDLAGIGIAPHELQSGYMLRTSARNMLRGDIAAIQPQGLTAQIEIAVAPSLRIRAEVTHRSVGGLGLHGGRTVLALIKANVVSIVGPGGFGAPDLNRIAGHIAQCEITGDQAEIILDAGHGISIAALIPAGTAWQPGMQADALFDPRHVIIAVD